MISGLKEIEQIMLNQSKLRELKAKEELKKYDTLDRYPGTIRNAKCHLLANKFGYLNDEEKDGIKKCPCCQEFVENNTFEFIFNEETFKRLTSGVTMFFYTIKIFVIYLVMKFIISDIYNLYMNYTGNFCATRSKIECGIYIKLSIDNRSPSTGNFSSIQVQQILDLITVIASILYFVLFKKLISKEFATLDQSMQTQDDYTVYLTDLPIYIRDTEAIKGTYQNKLKYLLQNQVKYWIRQNLDPNQQDKPYRNYFQNFQAKLQQYNKLKKDYYQKNKAKFKEEPVYREAKDFLSDEPNNCNIVVENGVELCWNLHQFQVLDELKNTLKDEGKKMFDRLEKYQKDPQKVTPEQLKQVKDSIEEVKYSIRTVNEQFLNLSKEFGNPNRDLDFYLSHYIGKALVKFEFQHFAEYIKAIIQDGDLYIKQSKIDGDKAAAPSDIFWKNLHLTVVQKNARTLIAFLITCGALVISLGLLLSVSYLKENVTNQLKAQALAFNSTNTTVTSGANTTASSTFDPFTNKIKTYALSGASSVIIVIINYILKKILLALSEYERKESRTQQLIAFIWKLLVAQFVNTALIYYFTCELILKLKHYDQNGIINSVTSLFTTSSGIEIVLNIGNPFLFMAIFFMRFKYGDKNAWNVVKADYNFAKLQNEQSIQNTYPQFQDRLNKNFELPLFAIEERYVYYLLQVYIIAFYGFLIPAGTPIMIIVFLIEFFIDRLNLLRFSTLQVEFDFNLTRFVFKLFETSILITTIGNFIFNYNILNGVSVLSVVSLAISIIYMLLIYILPQKFQAKLFADEINFEKIPYSQAVHNFKQTYDNQNPGTRLYSAPSHSKKAQTSALTNPAQQYI